MEPEQGVRFELRLDSRSEGRAAYALRLETASSAHAGRAELSPAGEVRLEWSQGGEPPPWCVAALRAQLRLLFRDHGSDGSYPRRLTRWRPQPAASGRAE